MNKESSQVEWRSTESAFGVSIRRGGRGGDAVGRRRRTVGRYGRRRTSPLPAGVEEGQGSDRAPPASLGLRIPTCSPGREREVRGRCRGMMGPGSRSTAHLTCSSSKTPSGATRSLLPRPCLVPPYAVFRLLLLYPRLWLVHAKGPFYRQSSSIAVPRATTFTKESHHAQTHAATSPNPARHHRARPPAFVALIGGDTPSSPRRPASRPPLLAFQSETSSPGPLDRPLVSSSADLRAPTSRCVSC